MRDPVRSNTCETIVDLENNKIGQVIDRLSVQFTADFSGTIKFFFYNDKGATWRPTSEGDLP